MLILTEKPGVAKDFANALGCTFSLKEKCWISSDKSIYITNCVGHIFELEEPSYYEQKYKSWKNLPVIPDHFSYRIIPSLKQQAAVVGKLLKANKSKEILIATDADREGEIIARECLMAAGIYDYSKIKRFWESQALTSKVIKEGMANAKPLKEYDLLSQQGFARQHSDWLVGINGTRFITNKEGSILHVGRVQTAVLNAICNRCSSIKKFKPEQYYEIEGLIEDVTRGTLIKAIYSENGKTKFKTLPEWISKANDSVNIPCEILNVKTCAKEELPPQLYNLNDLQKDAFRCHGFSAEKTLAIVQKLYEEYKCVSYPRTPSRVMGSANVQMVKNLYSKFLNEYSEFINLLDDSAIEENDKRHFNDAKLEAHHALIPLNRIPASASDDETKIYLLILERFLLTFGKAYKYNQTESIVSAGGKEFIIKGNQVLDEGWKKYGRNKKQEEINEEEIESQSFSVIDWNKLALKKVKALTKFTKPPKYFNEASVLSFMENPKSEEGSGKLAGLGTPATRHSFIPKLLKLNYIEVEKKNIKITPKGIHLLELLKSSSLNKLCDIAETTRWEESLSKNPIAFENEIKRYIEEAVKVISS